MRLIIINLVCLLLVFPSLAQHPNILISDSFNPNEPSIAIDPENTNVLVAGSNLNSVYYSVDGGYNWSRNTLTSAYGVWGDPCIVSGNDHVFYFFHLSNPSPEAGTWIDRIVCQKTTSNGADWSPGTYMGLNGGKEQDKEWAVVDRSNGNIYVTWTQFDNYGSPDPADKSVIRFSKSVNGGESWSEAVVISQVAGDCIDDDNTTEGAVPAVGPNGEIYVSWSVHDTIYFDRSQDQGETWLEEDIFVTQMPGGWAQDVQGIYRCNGMPVTACDTSGGNYHGNIYINWTDERNGAEDIDVLLIKSTDGGNTWSDVKRVNDDPPGSQQFFTWMTIDQATGFLWFVFYDRRNHLGAYTDVYMAVSKDGGETFKNFKVSESRFSPGSSVFFGDYTNITAYNNVVRPIWTRLNQGLLSMWTAIINVDSIDTYIEPAIPLVFEESYPNPFNEELYFSFKLKRDSYVNISLYNMYGNLVQSIADAEYLNYGKHIYRINAEKNQLKPGVYFIVMSADNQKISKKIAHF